MEIDTSAHILLIGYPIYIHCCLWMHSKACAHFETSCKNRIEHTHNLQIHYWKQLSILHLLLLYPLRLVTADVKNHTTWIWYICLRSVNMPNFTCPAPVIILTTLQTWCKTTIFTISLGNKAFVKKNTNVFRYHIYYQLVAHCFLLLLIIALTYFSHNSWPSSGS